MRKIKALLLLTAVIAVGVTSCNSGQDGQEAEIHAGYENRQETPVPTENTGGQEIPIEYEYEAATIIYSELYGEISFKKNAEKTETDHAVYSFEARIDLQDRRQCIEATEKVLNYISSAASVPLEIMVLTTDAYSDAYITGNKLYVPQQEWNHADYITKVLLAEYGEWCNYGLAYGYANYLCGKLGWEHIESSGFMPSEITDLYDMNLLCFDEKYADTADIEAIKQNACYFVDTYLLENSEEEFRSLLAASGTLTECDKINLLLTDFYNENGAECELTNLRYKFGGAAFDYIAFSEYAVFYLGKEWKEETWELNPLVSENFLHENYRELKEFFERNLQQMERYQELFALSSYNNDLPIIFSNSTRMSSASFYLVEPHIIYLKTIGSLTHEYIHSLVMSYSKTDQWAVEGFARYFSYKYDYYGIAELNQYYNNLPDSNTELYAQEYLNFIGRPIDFEIDFHEIENIITYNLGFTNPDSSYVAGSSFIGYLVEQYGEENVIRYVCAEDGNYLELDKSYSDLVSEWNNYINENYSQYSKNR